MKWKNTFHEKINELWEAAKDRDHHITQEAFAQRLGVTRNALRGWLSGAGQPDADGFVRIADRENVSLEWLLGDERKNVVALRTSDESLLLATFRQLSLAHKDDLLYMARHYYEQDASAVPIYEAALEKRAV